MQEKLASQNVLVTGGAGYIGSQAVWLLRDAGLQVAVVDNLTTGFRDLLPPDAAFLQADVRDTDRLADFMQDQNTDTVLHFAASTVVPDSVADPLSYYQNNVGGTLSLIDAMRRAKADTLVFSSTAAVYGDVSGGPVSETAQTSPINPYGMSKLMAERIIQDCAAAGWLRYGILRYFNVAGADPEGRTGQATRAATHLVKVVVEAALGLRQEVQIFGDDYSTPDGTGVRDYIHVMDLADIHLAVLHHLQQGGDSLVLNCGYGRGFSVRQILRAVTRRSGIDIATRVVPRRAGDPAQVIANVDRLGQTLGWKPRFDDLEHIIGSALEWERRRHQRNAELT